MNVGLRSLREPQGSCVDLNVREVIKVREIILGQRCLQGQA